MQFFRQLSKKNPVLPLFSLALGASMGALSSIMDIGQTAGPVVTGMVVAATGYGVGFGASCLIAIIVCILFALSVRGTGTKKAAPIA